MAIYDTMQFVPNDIVTVGIGMAASMGQFLLSAGTKGKRYITPNARVLLHQPPADSAARRADIQTQAQLILDMKKRHGRDHRRADRQVASSRSTRTATATAGSPRRRRSSTASSTTSAQSAADVIGGGGTDD